MWGLFVSAVYAACSAVVPVATFEAGLSRAEVAFGNLDVAGFDAAMDEAMLDVGCIDAVVPPRVAARIHRLQGLRFYAARDERRALASFAASRALDPAWDWPETMLPRGHAARALWAQATTVPPARVAVPAPTGGVLVFDGTKGLERPTAWATVAQLVGEDFQLQTSVYLLPDALMFAYPSEARPARPEPTPKGDKPAIGWFVASGALAVASAGTYGAAAASADRFTDPTVDADLDALAARRRTTNTLVGASAGLLGAAAVAGVIGVAGTF